MLREGFLTRFRALQAEGRLTNQDLEETCASISGLETPSREAIRALCDIATLPDEAHRALGQRAIFTSIVERLSDSFDPADAAEYDRVFAQIIEDCRRRPEGRQLDECLNRFDIRTEQDLLRRKERLAGTRRFKAATNQPPSHVQRIMVLSRVTLGADVAVTSAILSGLATVFPEAAITLIGPPPIGELYANSARFQTRDAPYARRGGLIERLNNWVDLVRILDDERKGLDRSEYLIVDPDSRLTQLGLLPVTEDEGAYFFFESRAYQRPGKHCLAELAAEWGRETFDFSAKACPYVALPQRFTLRGARAVECLRPSGAAGVAAFNFGVGANETKRLTLEFEKRLTLEAFRQGYAVILDRGVGEERERASHIVDAWRAAGWHFASLDESNPLPPPRDRSDQNIRGMTWEGGPGGFAGLIAAADLYVGYDSAFQHIAGALGRPWIDMFAGQSNERFVRRWTPHTTPATGGHIARLDPATPVEAAIREILGGFPQSAPKRQNRL